MRRCFSISKKDSAGSCLFMIALWVLLVSRSSIVVVAFLGQARIGLNAQS